MIGQGHPSPSVTNSNWVYVLHWGRVLARWTQDHDDEDNEHEHLLKMKKGHAGGQIQNYNEEYLAWIMLTALHPLSTRTHTHRISIALALQPSSLLLLFLLRDTGMCNEPRGKNSKWKNIRGVHVTRTRDLWLWLYRQAGKQERAMEVNKGKSAPISENRPGKQSPLPCSKITKRTRVPLILLPCIPCKPTYHTLSTISAWLLMFDRCFIKVKTGGYFPHGVRARWRINRSRKIEGGKRVPESDCNIFLGRVPWSVSMVKADQG
jgi:hypothetical protein